MSILIWSAFGDVWATEDKVAFNGTDKTITVLDGVTTLSIRDDVYTAWVDWAETEPWATRAMRFSGGDPIPGGETGVTFFVTNGWKIVYDPTVVAVTGAIYSDDYDTAFWTVTNSPVYPATVSSLVNSAVSTQNVVTGTTEEIVAAVLAALQATQIPVNLTQVQGQPITGTGTVSDPWGP